MSPPSVDKLPATAPPSRRCPVCKAGFDGRLAFCPQDGAKLEDGPPGPDETQPASPQAARADKGDALVGQVLADRYRVVRKLGEGGMGEVWEAQHVYIDKRLALKVLRPQVMSSQDAVLRFQQEARAASIIGHENIVEVLDFGRLPDGGVYLAMEFLDGQSLAERIRSGPEIERAEALEIAVQVCRGLAAAHEKGIVHRDVKPENVFLARVGERMIVKVLDFGIAKVTTGEAPRLTHTGAVFGTPYYMSPEQALGKPLDARADIYSTGVILYELFTGRVPFDGESFMGILSQHITARPTPPTEVAPDRDVPLPVERVILKALAKDPADRFPSMAALESELARIAASSRAETEPRPATVGRIPWEQDRPSRGRVPTAAEVRSAEKLELDRPEAEVVAVEELPASAGNRKVVLGAVLGAAVVLVLLGGWVALGGSGKGTRAGAAAGTADKAGMAGTAGKVELREVFVETTPPGARILDGARAVGTTPVLVYVPVGKTRKLQLVREGYLSKEIAIDSREPRVSFALDRDPNARIVEKKPDRPARAEREAPRDPARTPPGPPADPYEALPPPPSRPTPNPPPGASSLPPN